MKKFFAFFFACFFISIYFFCKTCNSDESCLAENSYQQSISQPLMSIVIDDFGSYDQNGVEKILTCGAPLTCAVLPNTEFTQDNLEKIKKYSHEIILHMPMQSYGNMPESWYGPVYISNGDSAEQIFKKIDLCLKEMPDAKGFNIHIGSGVSKNQEIMTSIYDYAKKHNLYFLDSRTIETHATKDACKGTDSFYLGRDLFLEAGKNRSYEGVCNRINEACDIALKQGIAIVIGHVGAEGGENTAKAVCDMIPKIQEKGIKIVPLSEIYEVVKKENLKVAKS